MASTEAKNALANKANGVPKKSESTAMKATLTKMAQEIASALPSHMKSDRFQRVALTAFSQNPSLQNCKLETFLAAMMQSAQLGLEPNTPLGQAYLIPYGGSVQFQLGYKGLLDLAQRSGSFKSIYAHTVYENDDFEMQYGLSQDLKHKPYMNGDRGQATGYYAVYKLTNGGENFVYMTKTDVENHMKKFSKSYKNGPWVDNFDAMAKKTVLKQLMKYAPMSVEVQQAVASDNTVKSTVSEDMDLVENEIEIEADYEEVGNGEVVNKNTGVIKEEIPGQINADEVIDKEAEEVFGKK